MFTERLEGWRAQILSREVESARSQEQLPEAIARAERFSRLNINLGRAESLFYVTLMVSSGAPIAVALTFIPTGLTHMLLDGFNDMRIKYLKRAQDEQALGEYSRFILQPQKI